MAMVRIATSLLLFTFLTCVGHSQIDSTLLAELDFHGDIMVNAEKASHRQRAHETFYDLMSELLSDPQSIHWPLDSVVWLKVLESRNSDLRVLTWELKSDNDNFEYHGFVQTVDGQGDYNLFELKDTRNLTSEYGRYDSETWYGALYYGMYEFRTDDGSPAYLLTGFNANDSRTNVKMADVLTISDGSVRFGADVFIDSADVKSRIIIQYSDAVVCRMQFDREMDHLIYDHIILIQGGPEGPVMVPDGSYHGYRLEKGQWHFIDKVFTRTVDEPPGEGIREPEDLDIFGRKRND